MMSKDEIKKVVYNIVARNSCMHVDDTVSDKGFIEYFGEDSLDIVEQCMELESLYDISMNYNEVKKCTSPNSLIDVVYMKLKEKEGFVN